MTATVPDAARTLLDTVQPPCEVKTETGECTDPAAWLVTFTFRSDGRTHGPIPMCIEHYAALTGHRQQCRTCPALYDVRAEELR